MKRVIASLVLSLALVLAAEGASRLAFTTSVLGNGNLGSWADAGGQIGLLAADQICQARASAANLPDAEQFVAWLSDRNDDAYCRLLDMKGKRADNCGLSGLLPNAGPWERTDGTPFAQSLTHLVKGRVLSPLLYSEFGLPISSPFESFTATTVAGTLNAEFGPFPDCQMWSSSMPDPVGAFAPVGMSSGTTASWTDSGGAVSCDASRRLMCMQKGRAEMWPDRGSGSRPEAFITEANVAGNFGSIAGADAICVNAARAARLWEPESFRALVASTTEGVSVASRIQYDGPWFRIDGMLLANSKADLISGEVQTSLNVTELGNYVGYAIALTGANRDGTPSSINCNDWTAASSFGKGSLANLAFWASSSSRNWLAVTESSCQADEPEGWPRKLYCVSDATGLMHSGFDDRPLLPD